MKWYVLLENNRIVAVKRFSKPPLITDFGRGTFSYYEYVIAEAEIVLKRILEPVE